MPAFSIELKRVLSILAQIAVSVVAVVVAAAFIKDGQPAGLLATLQLVAGPGVSAALISTVLNRAVWFRALSGNWKVAVIGIYAAALPFLASLLIAAIPPDVWPRIEALWPAFIVAAGSFLGATLWYEKALRQPVAGGNGR